MDIDKRKTKSTHSSRDDSNTVITDFKPYDGEDEKLITLSIKLNSGPFTSTQAVSSQDPQNPLFELFHKIEKIEIIEYLLKNRISTKKPIFDFLNALVKIIADLEKDNEEYMNGNTLKSDIIITFLNQLMTSTISIEMKDVDNTIDLLLIQCDNLEANQYREIVNILAEKLCENKREATLLLLPKCWDMLNTLAPEDVDYKNYTIEEMANSKWSKEIYNSIIVTFSDLTLEKQHLEMIVARIEQNLKSGMIADNDLPSLAHNMLLLSAQGLKGRILRVICDYFMNTENHMREHNLAVSLSFLNAKVITCLNLHGAFRRDMDLAKEFLKTKHVLDPMNLSILLVISKMQRFKQPSMDILKNICTQYHNRGIFMAFQHVIEQIKAGWDQITESLFWFAVSLMDSSGIVITDVIRSLRNLGKDILSELYDVNDQLKDKIIDEILARIIMKSENSTVWFSLLHKLSNYLVVSSTKAETKLRESLNHFQNFSPSTVKQLLSIFKPILMRQPSFLNSIMLILKKSMFSRDMQVRETAITGYLQLLRNQYELMRDHGTLNQRDDLSFEIFMTLKRALSQPQSLRTYLYNGLYDLVSQIPQLIPSVLDLLIVPFQEIHDVRSKVVLDLSKCVYLVSQSEVDVLEPFDRLINVFQYCLTSARKLKFSGDNQQIIDGANKLFSGFVEKMSNSSTGSFRLSLSDDYEQKKEVYCQLLMGILESLIEYTGGENFKDAQKIFNFHQQLRDISEDNRKKKPNPLTGKKKAKKSDDEDEDVDVDSKKPKAKKVVTKKPKEESHHIFLSFRSIYNLMVYVYDKMEKEERESEQNQQFIKFILESTCGCVGNMISEFKLHRLDLESDSKSHIKRLTDNFKLIFPHVIKQLVEGDWEGYDVPEEGKQLKKKDKKPDKIQTFAAVSLDMMIQFVIANARTSFAQVFQFICTIQEVKNLASQANKNTQVYSQVAGAGAGGVIGASQFPKVSESTVLESMIQVLCTVIFGHSKPEYFVDWELLFGTMYHLAELLKPTQADFSTSTGKTIFQQTKKMEITNTQLVTVIFRTVVKIMFSFEHKEEVCRVLRNSAMHQLDLIENHKLTDEEVAAVKKIPGKIINEHTVTHVLYILFETLESMINSAKEIIAKLKKELVTNNAESKKQSEKEMEMSKQSFDNTIENLDIVCRILQVLCYSRINGTPRERFFKLLKSLYTVLTQWIALLHKTQYKTVKSTPAMELVINSSKLTVNIHDYLAWKGGDRSKDSKKLQTTDKARIKRESKLIPNLIQSAEKFEAAIIGYEKDLKLQLHKHFKDTSTTSRQFDIREDAFERHSSDSENEKHSKNIRKPTKKSPVTNIKKPTNLASKKKAQKRSLSDEEDNNNNLKKRKS
ncbi:hypothetical protein DLAC_09988 [Tieghemostelium lacteum]|uniref:Fanconi anemia group I protein n=1 Tax=Tieghemostelium lacteum TaxID=361077 RepID=A0A151Z5W3_TIELA|nr:hypothetical protein DLAC_09988 [Tieghemostelium lacteum]|eukprot:KYQ89327.1 hypothetical protein DLAC_09988 [Tieghemostelium lacteum]